jgi:DNA-binding winged helix-turn-helix (wHTH) protein
MTTGFLPVLFGEERVRLEFGDCSLDRDTREVFRRGKSVHVEPKAYRLLELLLDARPKAISKQELQEELWPSTYVSELALSRLVSVLRQALGDASRKPRLIRTVHGFGYTFCSEVKAAAPRGRAAASEPSCRLVMGSRQIALADGKNLIGRDPSAEVWLDRASVSRRHAQLVVGPASVVLEDLGSRNGTYVGRNRIESPTQLSSGDSIRIGGVTLVFRAPRGLGTTEPEISSRVPGSSRRKR